MTDQYKLYQNGTFYDYRDDIDEQKPFTSFSASEGQIKEKLQQMLTEAREESPWNETSEE